MQPMQSGLSTHSSSLGGKRLENRIRRRALDPKARGSRSCARTGRGPRRGRAGPEDCAQRLDGHVRLDRFPACQHLAPVHAHCAGAAISCRRTSDRPDRAPRSPLSVERVENAHPFLIRHPELPELARRSLCRVGGSARSIHRRRPARIARRKRVMPFDLAEPAGASRAPRRRPAMVTTATSRLSLRTKSGWKNGNS